MPPGPRLRRSEAREAVKGELVAAASRLFAMKGYEAATVAEIAEEAGYTIGALYSNFSGKRALFEAVFARSIDEQFTLAGSFVRSGGDLSELARALLHQDDDERREWLLWMEAVMEVLRDPSKRFPLTELEVRTRSSIAEMLQERLPQLEDASTLAAALQALWYGWMIGEVASQSDTAGLARAIEWLVAGAGAGGEHRERGGSPSPPVKHAGRRARSPH